MMVARQHEYVHILIIPFLFIHAALRQIGLFQPPCATHVMYAQLLASAEFIAIQMNVRKIFY